MSCAHCELGPVEFTGHPHPYLSPDLGPRAAEAPGTAFICIACGVKWRRSYLGAGEFVWERDAV